MVSFGYQDVEQPGVSVIYLTVAVSMGLAVVLAFSRKFDYQTGYLIRNRVAFEPRPLFLKVSKGLKVGKQVQLSEE